MLSFHKIGPIERRENCQFNLEVQGDKIIVKYGNMTGNMTMHKPIESALSWGLGLHSMNNLHNIDASLISLHNCMGSHTTYPILVLKSTY